MNSIYFVAALLAIALASCPPAPQCSVDPCVSCIVLLYTAAVLLRNLSSDSPLCSLQFPLPGIALVQLNKPESKNALSRAMLDQLSSALSSVRREQSLRAAVIWGGASCFCAGADLVERRSMDDAQVRCCQRKLNPFQASFCPCFVLHFHRALAFCR